MDSCLPPLGAQLFPVWDSAGLPRKQERNWRQRGRHDRFIMCFPFRTHLFNTLCWCWYLFPFYLNMPMQVTKPRMLGVQHVIDFEQYFQGNGSMGIWSRSPCTLPLAFIESLCDVHAVGNVHIFRHSSFLSDAQLYLAVEPQDRRHSHSHNNCQNNQKIPVKIDLSFDPSSFEGIPYSWRCGPISMKSSSLPIRDGSSYKSNVHETSM